MSTTARAAGHQPTSLQAGPALVIGPYSAIGRLWLTCSAPTALAAARLSATVPGTPPFGDGRAAPSVRGQRRQVVLEGHRPLQCQLARRQQRSAGRPCRRFWLASSVKRPRAASPRKETKRPRGGGSRAGSRRSAAPAGAPADRPSCLCWLRRSVPPSRGFDTRFSMHDKRPGRGGLLGFFNLTIFEVW